MRARIKVAAKHHEERKASSFLRRHSIGVAESANSPAGRIMRLQRTIGNQAVQGLFNSGIVHAKLRIGQPNDVYEQEADRVAEQVMRMTDNEAVGGRQSAVSKGNESIRMKPG